jgi:hypothetical protein
MQPRPFYTNAAKRATVVELLRDRSILERYSNRKIGNLAGVSEGLVRKLLEEIQGAHLSKSRQRLLALTQKCNVSLETLEEVIKNLIETRWDDQEELQEPSQADEHRRVHQKEKTITGASSLRQAGSPLLKDPPRKTDRQNFVSLVPEDKGEVRPLRESPQRSRETLVLSPPTIQTAFNEIKQLNIGDLALTIRRFLGEHSQPEDISQPMKGKIYLTLASDLERWTKKLALAYSSAEVTEAIVLTSEAHRTNLAVQKLLTLATGICVISAQPNLVVFYLGTDQVRFSNVFEGWGLVISLKADSSSQILAKSQPITTPSQIIAAIKALPKYEVQRLFFLLEVAPLSTYTASLSNGQILSRLESATKIADINELVEAVGLAKVLTAYHLVQPIPKKLLDQLCPSLESLSCIYYLT